MDNGSGNLILTIGGILVIALMIGILKYDKWKKTKHLRAYEKEMKKKYRHNYEPNNSQEEDEQDSKFEPPPKLKLLKKLNWIELWHKTTPYLMRTIWFVLEPISWILLHLIKIIFGIYFFVSEIKLPKINRPNQIGPAVKKIYQQKKYRYGFIALIFLLSVVIAVINFDVVKLVSNESATQAGNNKFFEFNKQHYRNFENTPVPSDGTSVDVNNSKFDSLRIQKIDKTDIPKAKETKKQINKPIIKKTESKDDDYLLIF